MSNRGPRGGRARGKWSKRKRTSAASSQQVESDLQQFFQGALTLRPGISTFDMDSQSEREQLADMMWQSSTDAFGEASTAAANVELASVLEVICRNTYRRSDNHSSSRRMSIRIESILVDLQRAQSQKKMPLLTARFSCACLRAQLPRQLWGLMSTCFPGLLATYAWTEEFVAFASCRRPPCGYEELPGVGGVMFDNYTRKVLYASQATLSSQGYLLNMTNWGTVRIPRLVAPANFDANRLCACAPIATITLHGARCERLLVLPAGLKPFGQLSMRAFTDLFAYANVDIRANRERRFVRFLHAAGDGTLFERPPVQAPFVAYVQYSSPPMWNRLQSSYADVEAELNTMRNSHLDKRILFVGGDGLSILRINHLLRDHPDLYLDSAPFIIPMQGEAPHGVFHVMHGGWRLYQPFIRAAAIGTLGNDNQMAVMDDPNVEHFNHQLYALWWMTRACSEYLLHLSRTQGAVEIDMVPEFLNACERNIDLAYVAHFLFDFAFLVLDFKQGVRSNDSKLLDLLWREFYAIGRTGRANKTQYVPMSIMRVFWGLALNPSLAEVYHSLRALPMSSHAYVGWDTPIEWLNGAITQGVSSLVSPQRIARFVSSYALLESNYHALLDATSNKVNGAAKMKEMDSNVDAMKSWLMNKIGADWATATRDNDVSNFGIRRGAPAPWDEIRTAMHQDGRNAVDEHVARTVRELTSTFFAFRE